MSTSIASSTKSSSSFRRIAAAGLVASALIGSVAAPAQAAPCYFGECERAPAASSEFRTVARHGTWVAETDGSMMFVSTSFDDGSKFAIADKNEKLFLVFSYKGWHWKEGRTFPIKIDIDGEIYNGTIEAASDTMLIAKNVNGSFIKAFYNGSKAKVEVAGDTFTIGTLKDGAATIDDAVKYQKSASR